MKRKRYSDEQIAFALRQAESGKAVAEICRKLEVSEQTFYRWKKQYAGIGTVEIRRLKQLEEENAKLKRLVADLSLGQDHAAGHAAKKPGSAKLAVRLSVRVRRGRHQRRGGIGCAACVHGDASRSAGAACATAPG